MLKQCSPLRYPGGKSKLIEPIAELISLQQSDNLTYIEPFAGGAGLALSLLFSDTVAKIIINDFDPAIYAFWFCVLHHPEDLIKKIEETEISIDAWHHQREIYKSPTTATLLELGFATFFLNRTNRSGIIKAGVIGGKNQLGNYKLDCRYNKKPLIERILKISARKNDIAVYNFDALDFINKIVKSQDSHQTFIFFDPPYFKKGKELYTNFYQPHDHENLALSISDLEDYRWIVTYDECDEINALYNKFSGFTYSLNYSLAVKKKASELIYFSNKFEEPIKDLKIIFNKNP